MGLLQTWRNQARRSLPDSGAVLTRLSGGAEVVRRHGEPKVDHARRWPGAAPQDQRLPGHEGSQRAGNKCTALQLGAVHTALELLQIRVRDVNQTNDQLNRFVFEEK